MKIHGAEGMSAFVIRDQLDRGAKFVVYQYCISFIFITYKRSSRITLLSQMIIHLYKVCPGLY